MSKNEVSLDDLLNDISDGKTKVYSEPSNGYPYDPPKSDLPQVERYSDGTVRRVTAPPVEYDPNQQTNIIYNFDMSTKTVINNISVKKTSNNVSLAVGDAVVGALGGMLGKLLD